MAATELGDGIAFGAACRDMTPVAPVWLAGYSGRDAPSTGVSERLLAAALAVHGAGGEPALVVSLDLAGIPDRQSRALREHIAAVTGVAAQRILIACSHTHFAPSVGLQRSFSSDVALNEPDDGYLAGLFELVARCCADSLGHLRPGRLEVLRTRVPQVHFNRRPRRADGSVESNLVYPADPSGLTLTATDDELVALRLRWQDTDAVGAILVNFACHPVTGDALGNRQSLLVSSDYVHYLRAGLEEGYAAPVMFTLGAAGDVVPMRRLGQSRKWIGRSLADAVLLGELAFTPQPVTEVEVRWDEVTAATRIALAGTDTEQPLATAAANYDAVRHGDSASSEAVAAARASFVEALSRAYKQKRWPEDRYVAGIQYLRLGAITLVALPFEVMAQLALEVKREDPNAVVISCANGYEGYLPFEDDLARGGYESQVSSAHLAAGSAELIRDRILERLRNWG